MTPQVKQEIQLNDKIVEMIVTVNAKMKEIQEQIKPLQAQLKAENDSIINLITGICVQNGMDLEKDQITFSDDFKTIYVHAKPDAIVTEEEIFKAKKTRKKLN